MTQAVEIRGDGVSAYCCAHLLSKAGLAVQLQPLQRPRVPALLLSYCALALMRDIFGQPRLFESLPVIERRRVAWERDQQPVEVEHRAVVVSEQQLLDALAPQFPTAAIQPDWTIHAAPPLPGASESTFGSRTGTSWRVELRRESMPNTCTMESLPRGWLFLLPAEPGYGWLLAVGDLGPDPLASSKVVSREVLWLLEHSQPFRVAPRIASPLAGPGWLACGTAAMTFDPICGDGVAQAIREAILAAAVVRAALKGEPMRALIEHYESRMRAGFARHLELLRAFYSNGYGGVWWDAQVPASTMPSVKPFHYRLQGLDLEAVAP